MMGKRYAFVLLALLALAAAGVSAAAPFHADPAYEGFFTPAPQPTSPAFAPLDTTNPVPAVSAISPTSTCAGSAGFTLTVTGSNFVTTSLVQWNGLYLTTTFVDSNQLTADVLAADVDTGGAFPVVVVNPAPGGGTSNAATFTVVALLLSETHANVTCNGGANGSIDLTVSGGTAPYSYSWNDGPITQDRTALAAGTYTVTVADNNGCISSTSVTITQPAALSLSTTQVNDTCNGASSGSINLTVSGGTAPYTYLWGDGPTTEDRSGLAAATYSVTVTDANNCTASTSATITQPSAISLGTTQVNDSCNGGSNGSINLTVSGGTGPYTYLWNDGPTTEDRSGLTAGTYTVTVTDAAGCTSSTSVTITQPAALNLSTTQINDSCNGASNGSINLTVSGGTAPYTYLWNDGPTTEDRSGLAAGTYSVTVTDANNCTASTSATITQPAVLTLGTTHVNVSCNGASTGSINLTVSGGTAPYTYLWSDGPTVQNRTGLAAGTYTVTVTDAHGCTASTGATITQPPALVLSTTQVNEVCFGGTTGSITLTVSGGTAPYTYLWSDGPTVDNRTALAAGTYSVTVTDANLCTASTSVTITQPPQLVLSTTQVNVACSGGSTGSIDLTVSGGTAPYTYLWNDGPTSQDRSGLAAGTYSVTVTDAAGCTASTSATITQSGNLLLTETHVNVGCNGASTGSIDLTVSGGTPPYSYSWADGPTTQDRLGLPAGTYSVTVTDSNGCLASTSVTITQPAALVLSDTHTNVACNGGATGAIDLTVTGGTAPYTYAWTGGLTIQDPTGLTAGTYSVTVTDNNGCTASTSVTITQPAPLVLGTTHVNNTCFGGTTGSITLTVTGGTVPYAYAWNDGPTLQNRSGLAAGTYTVTVTDSNGCTASTSVTITQPTAIVLTDTHVNVACSGGSTGSIDLTVAGGTPPYTYLWADGPTTQDRSGLAAGTYTVTVTDSAGCTASTSVTISQAGTLALTDTHLNVGCNGGSTGSIDLTVTGGTPPYAYLWADGPTTQDRSGLAAGTYTVTVSDTNGCSTSTSVTITQPAVLALSTTFVNVACNGGTTGSINLTVSGGTAPYTHVWADGPTTEDRSGLAAGSYSVTVTDSNGCTASTGVTITQPPAIVLTETHVNVACSGGSTGSIDLTVSGGVPPYTYSWSDGPTTQDRTGLAAGTYTVTVTDSNGCTASTGATITQSGNLLLSATHTNVSCNGGTNGSIDLTVTGGTAPYTYAWTGGVTTQDRTGLAAGTYTVTVTDSNGCTALDSVTITQPAVLALSDTHVNVACNGGSTGSIDLTVAGGTAPYTYAWNDGATTQDRSGLSAGTYSVTVTDTNGCTASTSVTVTQPAALALSTTHVNVACNAGLTGSIDLTVTGGTVPYTYSWADGPTTQDRSGLAAGTYTVTVTDSNGCTASTGVTITQPPALVLSTTQVNVACNGGSTGSIDLTVSGGTPPYAYHWNDGPTTQDRSGLAAGTYTVTVTDSNGCTASTSATITQAGSLTLTETHVNILCSGGSTGSIDLTVTGGTPPYAYSWSDGPTTQDRSGLAAGTYTVTVTDSGGCLASKSVTITQPAPLALSETHVNVACNGGTTGSIDLTVAGGTAPYTYAWTGGVTTQDRTGLVAGTYSVTVTDANACTASLSVTITQPPALVLTETHTNEICSGGSTGTIDLTVAGGTPPYTYAWNDGGTSEDRTGLAAATYGVTVTDAHGCTAVKAVTITQPAPLVLSETHVNVLCNGSSTGSIDLTVSGGTAPYTYAWADGPATQDRSGIPAGSYTVTVVDVNGCASIKTVSITQPAAISISPATLPEAVLGLAYLQTISATGGSLPYRFSAGPGLPPGITLSVGGIISGIPTATGTFTFAAIDSDAHNCTGSRLYSLVVRKKPSAGLLTQSAGISNVGDPVTFTDSVHGTSVPDGGTVQFRDGLTDLGTPVPVDINGVASVTVGDFTVGTHLITAFYSGTALFDSSTSNVLSHVVAYDDTNWYRTATYEQWALSRDAGGNLKPVKRKPVGVDFELTFRAPDSAVGFSLDMTMPVRAFVLRGNGDTLTPVVPWVSSSSADFDVPVLRQEALTISGHGFKGQAVKMKVTWHSLRASSRTYQSSEFRVNRLTLPLPNLHNVGEELLPNGSSFRSQVYPQGLAVGVMGPYYGIKKVTLARYRDVQASMVKKTGSLEILHTGGPRCLDNFDNGAPIVRAQRSLSPGKQSNILFAELLTLRLSIGASVAHRFPNGLGELTYYDELNPSDPFNGLMLKDILALGDSVLACGILAPPYVTVTPQVMYDAVHRINASFASPVIDTVSFALQTWLKGTRSILGVPFLHKTQGIVPLSILTDNIAEPDAEPTGFTLEQNYPNPFNPVTTIAFDLAEASFVSLKIYNALGQEVASFYDHEQLDAGAQDVDFDASGLPSGVYFYRLLAQPISEDGLAESSSLTSAVTKKMLLLK